MVTVVALREWFVKYSWIPALCDTVLRAIARENRADLTDRGRPISSIFWPFNTFHQ